MLDCPCTKCSGEEYGDPYHPCENAMMENEHKLMKSQMDNYSFVILFVCALVLCVVLSFLPSL